MHFRNNETDFWNWCRHYLKRAKSIVRIHNQINNVDFCIKHKTQYNEAQKVIQQYEVLKCSLSDEQNLLLEKALINNESFKYNIKAFNHIDQIMRNWSRICFPKYKLKLKSIDKVKIGKIIREQRLYHDMSLKFVADLLQISEATLKSYEMGARLVRLDVMYHLSQIYNITIDDLIQGNT
jgi:ubiquinone/menaquinone biosynthesis C-methylase UbiE